MQLLSFKERVLIFLAERDAFTNSLKMTTPMLSKYLGTSQQSASRLLIQLEKEGFIERRIVGRTSYVKITEKGLSQLREVYLSLKAIFERPVNITLEGRVFTGLGEGAYYISLPGYAKQIEEKLGFRAYPGTLNISLLSRDSIENRHLLQRLAPIEIHGFRDEKRTYGGAKAIKAVLNDTEDVAILFVERTQYDNSVLEVIAEPYLRGKLGLKDGDKVKLTVVIPPSTFFENFTKTKAPAQPPVT